MAGHDADRSSVIPRRGLRAVVEEVLSQIRQVYLDYPQPLVVGYSGGKDSTAVVQLVWHALAGLSGSQLAKPVYVIAADTGVETPLIAELLDATLTSLQRNADENELPIRTYKVRPAVADSFWVNLIGRGYPAPTVKFRWCTDRLKIRPANTFIQERVAEFGEVIMVLGVRSAESSTRSQLMHSYQVPGHMLRRHSTLPGAYVFAPIEHFTADDVWTYLLQVPSPWGGDNERLAALYRNASGGECPLVIDTSTPSCGNTRFGCWVCTVALRDSSMESLVDGGEAWLSPLLEFRDLLARTTDPTLKLDYRDFRGVDGRLVLKRDGELMPRAYKFSFCAELLERLLSIETQLGTHQGLGQHPLVSLDELREIRRIWQVERQDWADTLPSIYRRTIGGDLDWPADDTPLLGSDSKNLLRRICQERDVPPELAVRMIDVERKYANMGRRARIFKDLQALVRQDWSVVEPDASRPDTEQLGPTECDS
jgi:DNA sulfur modification protein DndC